jgi:hypothetical protein
MTAEETADGQPKAFEGTVLQDGLTGIFAARGCESARGTQQRRDADLVEADGQYQEPRQEFHDSYAFAMFSPILRIRVTTRRATSAVG